MKVRNIENRPQTLVVDHDQYEIHLTEMDVLLSLNNPLQERVRSSTHKKERKSITWTKVSPQAKYRQLRCHKNRLYTFGKEK